LLQGVLALTRKYSAAVVNHACKTALGYHAFRYRTLVTLCKRHAPPQQELFTDVHELIRPLSDYNDFFQKGTCNDQL
jgi:hypothetical protein